MSTVLAGIDLEDAVWTDRLRWPAVSQIEQPTLGGGVVIAQRRIYQGRPITLDCWLLESHLTTLCGLRDQGATMALNLSGQSYSVLFRHGDGAPIDYEPFDREFYDPDPGDLHAVTLRLLTL